jgi:hypothetical protein
MGPLVVLCFEFGDSSLVNDGVDDCETWDCFMADTVKAKISVCKKIIILFTSEKAFW